MGTITQGTLNRLINNNNAKKSSATLPNKRQPVPVHARAPFQTKPEANKKLKKPILNTQRPVSKTQPGSRGSSASSNSSRPKSSSTSSNSGRLKSTKSEISDIRTINVKELEDRSAPSPVMSADNVVQAETATNLNWVADPNLASPHVESGVDKDVVPPLSTQTERKPMVNPFRLASDG